MNHDTLILSVAAFATLGVITRPVRIPEYVWAVVGAVVLIAFGFLPWRNAVAAAAKGMDVYLFLIGMMLLAEVGRQEGLFDWLAALAVRYAILPVQSCAPIMIRPSHPEGPACGDPRLRWGIIRR